MLQKKIKLSFKVCCYLQSQKVWASIIQNHVMYQKKAAVWKGLLTDQISLKKYFMLILGLTFLVLSKYSFPRLQLYFTKRYEIIFVSLRFYLRLHKKGLKSISQNLKISVSQTGNSNIFVLCGVICYVQHL